MRELKRDGEVIRYLNVKEAAEAAAIPYKTMYSYVRKGKLNAFQLGGKRGDWSIKESDLWEFLETGKSEKGE